MMPGDDSLVFKSWVDPEGRGKLVLTEQTWHGSSTSANMCGNKVLFSQGGYFFFPNWGKHSSVWETKYLVFFPSPKMQLKHKGYLCIFWMREKKNEVGSSGKGERCVLLSFTCPTARLWVSGAETPLLSCPCPLFPHLPFGMSSVWMGAHRGLWPSSVKKTISTLDPGAVIVPTRSASLKDRTEQMTVDILKCQPDFVALV